jgi:hypothetical protein
MHGKLSERIFESSSFIAVSLFKMVGVRDREAQGDTAHGDNARWQCPGGAIPTNELAGSEMPPEEIAGLRVGA